MNKKIILLMAAVIIALICISPIMASDDGFSVQNFLKFGDDTPSLEFEDLHILKLNREHTDSNGNVKKSTGFYLLFNLTSDSESMGNYSVEINCFDKNGKLIDTINSYVDHEGKFKIPLKGVSKVESVNMTVKKDNGDVIVNVSTDVVKVDKKVTKEEPVVKQESSTSNSDVTYWASANSDKFHYPNCEWAQKISSKNKVVFHSRDEALNSGYSPCHVCSP